MRIAQAVVVSDADRRVLRRWSRGRIVPARLVLRAKIVLLAAAGKMNNVIVAELGTGMKTVCLWRNRFAKSGLQGIEKVAPRGGRPSDVRVSRADGLGTASETRGKKTRRPRAVLDNVRTS